MVKKQPTPEMDAMQSIFVTLAQVAATLAALIFASTVAYTVYLNERKAQVDEQILERQHTVRNVSQELQSAWPWTLATLTPVDFEQKFRASKNIDGIEAVRQVLLGCMPGSMELEELVLELEQPSEPHDLRWRGRLFFWALTESVDIIGWGGSRPRSRGSQVFPEELTALGFDQWRDRYERLRPMLKIATATAPIFVEDFDAYAADKDLSQFSAYYSDGVRKLDLAIEAIDGELRAFDVKSALASRYNPSSSITLDWISVLLAVTVVTGIILPLVLVAVSPRLNWIGAVTVIILAVIPPCGALGILGRDVLRVGSVGVAEYLVGRWAIPGIKEIATQIPHINSATLIEWTYFHDASLDFQHHLPGGPVAESLERYISAGQHYNASVEDLNRFAIEAFERESFLESARTDHSCGGQVVTVLDLIELDKLDQMVERAQSRKDSCVIFSIKSQYWSRDVLRWTCSRIAEDPIEARRAFSRVLQVLSSSEKLEMFRTAQTEVLQDGRSLESAFGTLIEETPNAAPGPRSPRGPRDSILTM